MNLILPLLEGHIYKTLKNLFESLSSGSNYHYPIQQIINYGDTSGWDILSGILTVFQTVAYGKNYS